MGQLHYKIFDNGDAAITIIFYEPISEELSRNIIQIAGMLRAELADKLLEVIPAYQSLTLNIRPLSESLAIVKETITAILERDLPAVNYLSKALSVPVCYQDEFAPDLAAVAKYCGMSTQEVVIHHSQATYLVHMLGFLPGFLYLGGLDPKLNCPRKETPETKIIAGSVGIGGNQTGIYPVTSPGGWQIIGRTPCEMFIPENKQPFLASPLDKIKFVPIDKNEYYRQQRENR